jgi:hypothetical protein
MKGVSDVAVSLGVKDEGLSAAMQQMKQQFCHFDQVGSQPEK